MYYSFFSHLVSRLNSKFLLFNPNITFLFIKVGRFHKLNHIFCVKYHYNAELLAIFDKIYIL